MKSVVLAFFACAFVSCGDIVAPAVDAVTLDAPAGTDAVAETNDTFDEPVSCVPSIERCDGEDNDCDGETDEGFNLSGIPVGEGCGLGRCAGGTVVCDERGAAFCSSEERAVEEVCYNNLDDDCDGVIDEGCLVLPADIDGDGVDNLYDCDPLDGAFFPGAPESCCLDGDDEACDTNCDGAVTPCSAKDADGDGYPAAEDCNDNSMFINPSALEKCGNGIDEDCKDGDLPCDLIADADNDGFGNSVDCEPDNGSVFPGAIEICDGRDNDCDGLTDEGNPGGGALCEGPLVACGVGIQVCSSSAFLCTSPPPLPERCDGIDNDCDGTTDEDFSLGASEIGEACLGQGSCALGVVECLPSGAGSRCSSDPGGSEDQSAPEICDGVDNDCDGATDEELSLAVLLGACKTQGVCAQGDVQASCSSQGVVVCDYAKVSAYESGVEKTCDGLDNNCDGYVDETFGVGAGCYVESSDLCAQGVFVCNVLNNSAQCQPIDNVIELCDGLDNDCDGLTDEGFQDLGTPCDGPDSDLCENGVLQCAPDGSGLACLQENVVDLSEICANGSDDDCDGTIDEQPCTPGT